MSKKFEHGGPTFSHHIPLKISSKLIVLCDYQSKDKGEKETKLRQRT